VPRDRQGDFQTQVIPRRVRARCRCSQSA
jgi:hypothetical protein